MTLQELSKKFMEQLQKRNQRVQFDTDPIAMQRQEGCKDHWSTRRSKERKKENEIKDNTLFHANLVQLEPLIVSASLTVL